MSILSSLRDYVALYAGECALDYTGPSTSWAVELSGGPRAVRDLAGNRSVVQDFVLRRRCFTGEDGLREAAHEEVERLAYQLEGGLPVLSAGLVPEAVECGGILFEGADKSGRTGLYRLDGQLFYYEL